MESTKYQNPMEYLKIFFRRKWLFIAPAFTGMVLGISAGFMMPPTYESNTLILVEEEKILNPLIQGLAVSTTAVQRMQNIREQILGWNSLVTLTKKLDLAKNTQSQLEFEGLIMGLRKDISVQMRGPNIIKIAYIGKSPEETRIITQTLADNLVDENMRSQTKEAGLAIDFIKEQLDVYKRKIKETEVSDLEEQLKTLLVDSTEQHPLVKQLRHKLNNARKELESGEFQVESATSPKDSPAYQALQQEIDKTINQSTGALAYASGANEANDPNTSIYKLMLMDKLESAQARDKNVNEHIYNMLLQKLETAKITQRLEASKQGTRYTVLDPPRLPLRAAGPNKLKVLLVGLFIGSFAGAGLVFGSEFMDRSFLDIEDAKANLDLPVLGAISRLTTQEEINKERTRERRLIQIFAVAGAVLIITVMLIAFFRR